MAKTADKQYKYPAITKHKGYILENRKSFCDLMKIEDKIFWIAHAGFYIKANGTTIFIDPFKVSDKVQEKADLILLTHAHFDHTNKPDIEKVRKDDTKFIAAQKCLDKNEYKNLVVSKPGFKTSFDGIAIEAVPAYNLKSERLQFHPKSEQWVGYIITVDGERIYHSGDTDMIPEMEQLSGIDIAFLPMGGTYTMTLDEAAEAATAIAPKTVVPMHYKMLLGEAGSAQLEKNVKAKIKNVKIMSEVQDPIYSF
jgi:L-ascorbate metabolism protein UlaG (beta-lactamase superfamily)